MNNFVFSSPTSTPLDLFLLPVASGLKRLSKASIPSVTSLQIPSPVIPTLQNMDGTKPIIHSHVTQPRHAPELIPQCHVSQPRDASDHFASTDCTELIPKLPCHPAPLSHSAMSSPMAMSASPAMHRVPRGHRRRRAHLARDAWRGARVGREGECASQLQTHLPRALRCSPSPVDP
jgi:hypothetical protein